MHELFEERCKWLVAEELAKKASCESARWTGQIGNAECLFLFFSQSVPDVSEFIVLFRFNMRVNLHDSSHHKKTSFAKMMTAALIWSLIRQFLSEMFEGCEVERIFAWLCCVGDLWDIETGLLKNCLKIMLPYLSLGDGYCLILWFDSRDGFKKEIELCFFASLSDHHYFWDCWLLIWCVVLFLAYRLLFANDYLHLCSFKFNYLLKMFPEWFRLRFSHPPFSFHLSKLGLVYC